MNRKIDREIRMRLLEHDITIPDTCSNRIDETIHGLPDIEINKSHLKLRAILVIAAVCILGSTITAFAAIDYVRNRMENLTEEEKNSYNEGLESSPANADSYSRELSDNEKQRVEELRVKYENGTFPAQKLPVFRTQSEADGSTEFYFVEDTSLFVLPSRELTEEEILEAIDFYYSRDYSLNEKVKENHWACPRDFIDQGGMDEQKAIEMAKTDIGNIYGLVCENFEASVAFQDFEDNEYVYAVTLTDPGTMRKYNTFIDADQEVVTELTTFEGGEIDKEIKVDQEKFTAMYEEALDVLKKWKGTELPIKQSTCEYNYNSDNYLENGLVNYLFEMEDGNGYVLQYSCAMDLFFNIFTTNYEEYRQLIDMKLEKKKEKDISRKIIEMQ
jgi:hypothetical protein